MLRVMDLEQFKVRDLFQIRTSMNLEPMLEYKMFFLLPTKVGPVSSVFFESGGLP